MKFYVIIEIVEVSDIISGVISSHCHFPLENRLVTNMFCFVVN
jgi:hypothetical protein